MYYFNIILGLTLLIASFFLLVVCIPWFAYNEVERIDKIKIADSMGLPFIWTKKERLQCYIERYLSLFMIILGFVLLFSGFYLIYIGTITPQ